MSETPVELLAKLRSLQEKGETALLADLVATFPERDLSSHDLSTSGLSKAVSKLRKHENERVKAVASSAVSRWKERYQLETAGKSAADPREAGGSSVEPTSRPSAPPIDPAAPDAAMRQNAVNKLSEVFAKVVANHNTYRLSADELEGFDGAATAAEIEYLMHTKLGPGSNVAYKNKLRSLLFNLKDAKNTELVTRVILGSLLPEKLVSMDPKDMASSETKKWREQVTEYKKMELMDQMSYQRYAFKGRELPDGLFECPKCKSKKTQYTEKQTRSADEPTTKFCHCTSCDYRWKFC